MKICLSGISYQLGESNCFYRDAPNFDRLLQEYKLPDMAAYWGWGNFRKTDASIYDLLKPALEKTLNAIPVKPEEIDLVIFCSAGSGEYYHVVNEELGHLLNEAGLQNPTILGQSFTGCVSIFSAIKLGASLLNAGAYSQILVVTTDKIPGDVERFRKFAIYSDAASCFLLSSSPDGDYEVLGVTTSLSSQLMAGLTMDPDVHFRHLKDTHAKLTGSLQVDTKTISKVFMTNLYNPLVQINTSRLGYRAGQIFLKNIEQVGHCFSSDPLINLLDYKASVRGTEEDSPQAYMLAAMATGHAGFCLIQDNSEII